MNILDTIIIVVVGAAFVMSLFRGVIKEVFSLGSVILGFIIANYTYSPAAEFLAPYISHAPIAKITAYGAVFIGSSIAIRILGSIVERLVKKSLLGWADHLMGSLFGFLKGCLIVSVFVMLVSSFMPDSKIFRESKLSPRVMSTVGMLAKLAPDEIKKRFHETRVRLANSWKNNDAGELIGDKRQTTPDKSSPKGRE
jgi:membrane protein required for colicin V production